MEVDQPVTVPAAIVDTLVGLGLQTEPGKALMLGWRLGAGVPAELNTIVAQDARLVRGAPRG